MLATEIVIGNSSKEGIKNLFQVFRHGGHRYLKVIPAEDHAQTITQDVKMINTPFPYEITRIILLKTIYWLLQNKCLEEASQMMFINKDMLLFFHRHFVSSVDFGNKSILAKIKNLARTLILGETVYDCLSEYGNPCQVKYFCIESHVVNPSYRLDSHAVQPLHFFRRDRGQTIPNWAAEPMQKPEIMEENDFTSVCTGPDAWDIAWLMGRPTKTYFRCTGFKRPVICFALFDPFGMPLEVPVPGVDHYIWTRFAKLLKTIFGPNTGVYLVYRVTTVAEEFDVPPLLREI